MLEQRAWLLRWVQIQHPILLPTVPKPKKRTPAFHFFQHPILLPTVPKLKKRTPAFTKH